MGSQLDTLSVDKVNKMKETEIAASSKIRLAENKQIMDLELIKKDKEHLIYKQNFDAETQRLVDLEELKQKGKLERKHAALEIETKRQMNMAEMKMKRKMLRAAATLKAEMFSRNLLIATIWVILIFSLIVIGVIFFLAYKMTLGFHCMDVYIPTRQMANMLVTDEQNADGKTELGDYHG